MSLLLVAVLDIVGLVSAVLFVLGVPLVVGLMVWDIVDSSQRKAASATQVNTVADQVRPRVPAGLSDRTLTT